ncbi:MAG: threonine/serine exporter [Firmicutes bacterium]|nr:threonine/serine exporter [Bacillota bacterium]
MVTQFFVGGLAAITFGYIFRVPASQRLRCGLVGGLGWIIFLATRDSWGEIAGMFVAATCVAVLSELLARRHHQPVVVFLTPGVIPLVPGGKAYLTMLSFLQNDYAEGVVLFMTTLFLAGAVAAGIILTSSIFRIYSRARHTGR